MMKKQYYSVERNKFWENYWKDVGCDDDCIEDIYSYPLFPVNNYLKKDMHILEAGCGLGRVLKHYFYQDYHIVGIECDSYCVETLRKENSSFSLSKASITDIPFKSKSFDVAMAFGVIGHLEHEWEKALSELHRVLDLTFDHIYKHDILQTIHEVLLNLFSKDMKALILPLVKYRENQRLRRIVYAKHEFDLYEVVLWNFCCDNLDVYR